MKKGVRQLFHVNYFFYYFYLESFKSTHRKIKFREGLNKDRVTKISSTEFIDFGPAKPKHLFFENFCPKGNRTLQPK